MRRLDRGRAQRLALAALLAVGVTGCAPRAPVFKPAPDDLPLRLVIARVNANSRKMNFLLRAGGVSATVTYVDEAGTGSLELTGILLYRKPRDLYLRLQHTIVGKLEVGSNDERFWVWQQFEDRRYWWGEHGGIDEILEADIPIRPDHLLDVLGLADLPAETIGPDGPLFWVGSSRYELIFLGQDETGQRYITKTVDIDRREPFLVRSIVHFRPDGHPIMSAKLSAYEAITESDVLAPRRIEMKWLDRQSELKLEFLTMKRFDKKEAEQFFVSPLERGEEDVGQVIRVDRPALTSTPAPAVPADQPRTVMER